MRLRTIFDRELSSESTFPISFQDGDSWRDPVLIQWDSEMTTGGPVAAVDIWIVHYFLLLLRHGDSWRDPASVQRDSEMTTESPVATVDTSYNHSWIIYYLVLVRHGDSWWDPAPVQRDSQMTTGGPVAAVDIWIVYYFFFSGMEIVGETLHLYSVTRSEMGSYMCIARDTKHINCTAILFKQLI